MIQEFKLELERRSQLGRQAVKKLRREGKIPGVFYSATSESIPFYIDRRHLYQALQSESHVYAVSVGGKKLHAIFRELQYHPVTDEILHADLYGVRLKDKIDLMVPVVLEGEAPGVKMGGVLTQSLTELEIRCLATEVPDAVHIDVSQLELGDSVHAQDLKLGNIEVLTNPEATMVTMQAPRAEILVEEVEEEGIEEAEEIEEEKEKAFEEPGGKKEGRKKGESPSE